MGISDSPNDYVQVLRRVGELATAEGRDWEDMERAFYMTVNINSNAEAGAAEADDFLMAYYGVRHWTGRWGPWGDTQAVAEAMAAYAEAGARELVVRFASWDQASQLDQFVGKVVPAFRELVGSGA
jgi:hypothetical protein